MKRLRLWIPLIVLYLTGIVTLLGFFGGNTAIFGNVLAINAVWIGIIASVALLLGLGNIGRVHGLRIAHRERGYAYSIVLLLAAAATIGVGVGSRVAGQGPAWSDWVFRWVYEPLALALFGLLAFVLAATAVRTLRITSAESGLMLGGALIVLLGAVALPPFDGVRPIVEWFQNVPITAALRGVLIGVGLGAAMTSLRYLLGVDNRYLR